MSVTLLKPSPDELHELAIQECYERWLNFDADWSELVALINARSPQQVDLMEVTKGLR